MALWGSGVRIPSAPPVFSMAENAFRLFPIVPWRLSDIETAIPIIQVYGEFTGKALVECFG